MSFIKKIVYGQKEVLKNLRCSNKYSNRVRYPLRGFRHQLRWFSVPHKEVKKRVDFGPHLILDLQKCNKQKLKNVNFVFNLLNDLPVKIGMTKITAPYVFPYSGKVPEDKGITGIVIIAESHISVHTFQERDYVFIDVFSCRDFDTKSAAKYIINAFEAKKVKKNIVVRRGPIAEPYFNGDK